MGRKVCISLILVLALGASARAASPQGADPYAESGGVTIVPADGLPTADAGLPRYTDGGTVVLDGTNSSGPEEAGSLSYQWRQTSGQRVMIVHSNTPTPSISGFAPTDEIQRSVFELVVSNANGSSPADTVEVVIVPTPGATTIRSESGEFDPNRPTFIYFSGGNCVTGQGSWNGPDWNERANVLSFIYEPDSVDGPRIYDKCADLIIVYLSDLAPNYCKPIQVSGFSTGGQPAIDVANRLNWVYRDARYAINRVTFYDVACRTYAASVAQFLTSSVDGEQCWLDTYFSAMGSPHASVLNVEFTGAAHGIPRKWYRNSLTDPAMNLFNSGCVGGAYWSVVGPGKNLQLGSTPEIENYKFRWLGSDTAGSISLFDGEIFPGKLPEPVTLVGPIDPGNLGGAVLTCEHSANAIGYELLLGLEPGKITEYMVVSDTPEPPNEVITELPFERTWWTVRARDQHGSTIYADPTLIDAFAFSLPVENLITGAKYGYLQDAIDDADPGDELVAGEGIYREDIDFKGRSLIVRSANPDDPAVVAATVIECSGQAVTFSGGEDAACLLSGFTITGTTHGVYCFGASPTITKCSIVGNAAAGIELHNGSNPTLTNCEIVLNSSAGIEMFASKAGRFTAYNRPAITNCTIAGNAKAGVSGGIPRITNSIIRTNLPPQIAEMKGIGRVTYSNVQGGWSDEGNIDVDALFADPANGDYHLKSQAGRWDPQTQEWIADDETSPCIDAGDPDSDLHAESSPNGGRINMGAYGGTSQASKSFINGQ
jgi:parallel beta-helix repeat protein